MKRVKIEYQNLEVHKLQVLLNAVGFNFDYQGADLIHRTLKLDNKATLKDCVKVRQQWQKYFENKDLYTEI